MIEPTPSGARPEDGDANAPTLAPGLDAALAAGATLSPSESAPGPAGSAVPGYEILSELGRGGMGVVYRARQLGLNRAVALKMILAGPHASADTLARFRAEAEAVARLQHPNIVQIHEIGEHEGLPYFSMEYVPGGSLADRLAGTPLPPREAAGVVQTLAQAIHYAHEHGVVHRDLKPANVLLQTADLRVPSDGSASHQAALGHRQSAIPKITDFGLAKQLDSAQPQTRTGAVLGTPSYMAPEQAGGAIGRDGSRAAVGPATDVYALGAILYEMLSGRPPFKAATPLDTILQVVSEEPVAPSRLQPRLPRDLETICLKCLEKEPRRRYASAAALAEDLRRFQADEPILARAATVWERAVKWARRRPARAALLILSITSPLTLAVISLSYQARLQDQNQSLQTALIQVQTERDNVARAKQDVEREHQRAQAHLEKALEAVDRLLKRVGDENTTNVPQLVELRKKVLEEALDFYRGFLKQEGDEPAIRRETARAYQRSASLYFMLSKSAEAERASREAIKLQEKLVAEDPQQAAYRSDLSKSYSYLAHVYATTNRFKECYAAYDKALELSERLAREHPENSDYLEGFVRDCSNRGYSLQHQNPRESEKYFRMAVDKAEQLLAAHPGSDYYQCVVAGLYTNIATALLAQQRVAAARALLQKSSGMLVPADRPPPRSAPEYKATLAMTQVQQGLVSLRTKQPAQALASLEAGAAGFEEVLADTPKMLPYRFQLVTTYPSLADLHMQFKQPARALAALQRAVALAEGLAQDYPSFAWLTPEVERLRIRCLVIQARQGEAATTLAAAGQLADKKSLTGENAYDLACVYALAATNPRTRKDAADALLQRALALLLRADAAGYFAAKARIEHARKDGDLELLHARDEFKKLLDRAEIRLKNSPSAAKTG